MRADDAVKFRGVFENYKLLNWAYTRSLSNWKVYESKFSAKRKLPELIKVVEQGQIVAICRRGVPVVDLIPSKRSTVEGPKFGALRGRILIHDPEWWKAIS
jgi:antitoxin (DNA-binding transcriptional repressor) of toxin-antitoxin stability system